MHSTTPHPQGFRPPGPILHVLFALSALVSLGGCALLDYLPRDTRGRPEAEVRRSRAAADRAESSAGRIAVPRDAEEIPGVTEVREGVPAFSALPGAQARSLALQLDPATQTLASCSGHAE